MSSQEKNFYVNFATQRVLDLNKDLKGDSADTQIKEIKLRSETDEKGETKNYLNITVELALGPLKPPDQGDE